MNLCARAKRRAFVLGLGLAAAGSGACASGSAATSGAADPSADEAARGRAEQPASREKDDPARASKTRTGDAGGQAGWSPLSELPEGVDAGSSAQAQRQPPAIEKADDARRAIARGFYAEAERALDELVGSEGDGAARVARARLYMKTGRYEDAAREARRASGRDAVQTEAWTVRGEALAAQGELERARKAFEEVASEPGAHRARVLLGHLHAQRGETNEAERYFYELIDAYNDGTISLDDGEALAYVGMAAWGLRSAKDANEAFRQSARANEDRVETQLEWARLFLQKYDTANAEKSVRQALERNPKNARAHALLARIAIERNFDFSEADKHLDRALDVNPNLVMAHVTRAGMALRDRDVGAADAHLDRALEVNPRHLEALTVRAALRYIEGDTAAYRRAKKRVLDHNPAYSEMFTTIAEYADWEHRYPDIVKMAREALSIDPEDPQAYATLGLNLLRLGREEKGLEALREAWKRDRYNVQVYNTLNLYDEVIPKQYEEFDAAPFVFRMHEAERPILERYVPATLKRAYREMKKRYGFEPESPIRFELYADREHFGVRTAGLPHLGVQGVCFGPVVTAISPGGAPLNWGQITWHELAHVFHIRLSEHRVPRWFTEGLAEYEATIARPEWGRELDHMLWRAIQQDRLPELRLLNRAFTHASSRKEMMTAYYAATRVVSYIVDRFGFDAVVRMLRAWGHDRRTAQVVRDVLDVDIDQLGQDFRDHLERRLGDRGNRFYVELARFDDLEALRERAQQAPDEATAQAELAAGLIVARKPKAAVKRARKAIELQTDHALARYLLARLALARDEGAQAEMHIRTLLKSGTDGYELRLRLTRALLLQKKLKEARTALDEAVELDPERVAAWQGLAQLAGKMGKPSLRVKALEKIVRLDEHGRAPMRALLDVLAKREKWKKLVTYGEMGLFIDPLNPATHHRLGQGYLHTGAPDKALHELDVALQAEPKKPGPIHLARARVLLKLGRRGAAQKAAQRAVDADSSLKTSVDEILAD